MMTYLRRAGAALGHVTLMFGLGLAQLPLALLLLVALLVTFGLGLVFFFVPVVMATRRWTILVRRLTLVTTGVEIPTAYHAEPPPPLRQPDGWYRGGNRLYKSARLCSYNTRWDWAFKDPATWRDFGWVLAYPLGSALFAALPAALVVYGVLRVLRGEPGEILLGVFLGVVGVLIAPTVSRVIGLSIGLLLGPRDKDRLAGQVRHLAQARTEAVDTQAAQLRRIERDLHDGAQARLVAVGMTLGAAEQLLDTDPNAAVALLARAREASSAALDELRQLVRGIRPPILAERGLTEALRGLAVDSPLSVTVRADLPVRCDAAIESAVYFAVSELMTNAARHGQAGRVAVDLVLREGALAVTVADDGRGGADPAGGSGLRGIERRMATFDGTLALSSPPGGPTAVTLVVPHATLDSATRSSTSAKAVAPRWKSVVAGLCFGLFSLPLLPLGFVSLFAKLHHVPDTGWWPWPGLPASFHQWPMIIGMIALGAALLLTAIVLTVQISEAREPGAAE
ncbi:hypothetical protein Misp01_75710 [Microtetraspora sp. NBRC 13810]|uniref:sensor histidine kinase n=1 Tax=Microtetraspora sp. NBRC 13810 TaxID=3030990 RepID=UPI0024A5F597|nr:histidine kinase [Microtetraspora sp. NBRC 13810]GLW12443.1 hypothetical protein Misp01_75710 [Microtetraspora sp. NBRC 13810]